MQKLSQIVKVCAFLMPLFAFIPKTVLGAEAHAKVIVINNTDKIKLLGKQVQFLEDATTNLTIEQILVDSIQAQFQEQPNEVFSRPATRSAFWFKITIKNNSNSDLWLNVGSTYAWYIDFYSPDTLEAYNTVHKTGTMRPEKSKYYNVNTFWLPLNKANEKQAQTYYLRVKSGLTYELPLYVGSSKALYQHKDINDYLTSGFVGVVIIMFLFNLFIFLSTRDRIYIYYLAYLFIMLFSMPYANNYPFIQNIDFWFIDKAWWNENFLFWHCPVYLFIGLFCIRYLHLKKHSKLIRAVLLVEMALLSVVVPILTLFGVAFVDLVNITQLLIIVFYLSCLITGYYLAILKVKRAIYYVLGWTFMVTGAIMFFAVINGYLPFNPFMRNTLYYGSALEIWMFSLALGNRLNVLRIEKDKIHQENLNLVQKQNEILELKINERTAELEESNERLSESNKELTDLTEELNVQSETLMELNAAKDQIFAILSHDLRSPLINLKSLLYLIENESINEHEFRENALKIKSDVEHLHFSLNNLLQWAMLQMEGVDPYLNKINLQQLSIEVVELLKDYSGTKQVEIINNVQHSGTIYTDSEIVKLILRNFLYNAIKFSPAKSKVLIEMSSVNSYYVLSVKDEGIGMSQEKLDNLFTHKIIESQQGTSGEKGTGLGLVLCFEFANKIGEKIWAESTEGKGATFYFTISKNNQQ